MQANSGVYPGKDSASGSDLDVIGMRPEAEDGDVLTWACELKRPHLVATNKSRLALCSF
jgi:hypothetical protein